MGIPGRATDRFRFRLERFLLRGPQYRLLFIAAIIGLMSIGAGILVLPSRTFDGPGEAIWWAFLRLSDPGYLGDDEGLWVRTVSTALTVSGYVVFLGSLVAIMTQWLNATITRLESGLTPVTRNDHVVILGWTNRTAAIIREILLSGARVRRFLRHRGARSLHIVVLCEELTPALHQDLKDQLDELWDEGRITLRTGSPLRVEHLERADFLHAGVILVPGDDGGGDTGVALDSHTVKTLLSISTAADEAERDPPLLVAELSDARKMALARRAYAGPLELVASDAAMARLIVQTARHPGLSRVYNELLTQDGDGNELYLPDGAPFVGHPLEALGAAFPLGVVLGLVRNEGGRIRPYLNPAPGLRVETGDQIVVMARSAEDVQPASQGTPQSRDRGEPGTLHPQEARRRILVLGWSRKVPALLRELSTYRAEHFQVDVLATVPVERRERQTLGFPVAQERVAVRHIQGDYTVHTELLALEPLRYDNVILVGSDWFPSAQQADARTILGALLLNELASRRNSAPALLVEFLDPENADLLEGGPAEVLATPVLISHILAQVALRPELRTVFEELFAAGGTEVVFRSPSDHGLEGTVTFHQVAQAASLHGETALGVMDTSDPERTKHRLFLNPDSAQGWDTEQFRVVTLATYHRPPSGNDDSPGG
jgi:ion channel POLLUX/CASTOR